MDKMNMGKRSMENLDLNRLPALIETLCHAGQHPQKTVAEAMRQTKKPAVGMFPLFLPEELVYAAGYLPVGLWGGVSGFQLADQYLQSFACSILRANTELAMQGKYDFLKAILVPSQCDTLKCSCENMKVILPNTPIIGVTVPNHRSIPGALAQMLSEFAYLTEELSKLGDDTAKPMSLSEAFAIYEAYRAVMMEFISLAPDYLHTINAKRRHYIIKAAYFMDKAHYTALMRDLLDELKTRPKETFTGTRIIPTGIMIDAQPLLDLLVELDIAVVDDLLCHESMQFRTETRKDLPVSSQLAYRLLDLRAASPLYEPGKPRGQLLSQMVQQQKADAVLFCLIKFCDPEAFDQPLVKKDLAKEGIPMLSIEMDQTVESLGQLRTRIQAFLETTLR